MHRVLVGLDVSDRGSRLTGLLPGPRALGTQDMVITHVTRTSPTPILYRKDPTGGSSDLSPAPMQKWYSSGRGADESETQAIPDCGGSMGGGQRGGQRTLPPPAPDLRQRRPHVLLVHGGEELRPSAHEMVDAVASVFMGGLVLDLRHLSLPDRPLKLDVRVVMGGLEVQVPADWRVEVEVRANLGGVVDDRPDAVAPGSSAHLRIRGSVTMGGMELTHG